MRSLFATLRELVLPGGARPGTPRSVFGPGVPSELAAYYATRPQLAGAVVTAIRFESTTRDYTYLALVRQTSNGAPYLSIGRVDLDQPPHVWVLADLDRFAGGQGVVSLGDLTGSTTAAVFVSTILEIDPFASGGGDILYAGQSIVHTEPWLPVWSASGGFSLGNGTSIGRYVRQGELVYVFARLVVGSTTTWSGSLETLNLPFEPNWDFQVLTGFIRAAGPTNIPISARISSAGTGSINELYVSATGAAVTGTVPVSPSTGDIYQLQGWYIAA